MNITCPHCRTEYDAEESEYGRFVKCEICGRGFVVGQSQSASLKNLQHPSDTDSRDGQNGNPMRLLREKILNFKWVWPCIVVILFTVKWHNQFHRERDGRRTSPSAICPICWYNRSSQGRVAGVLVSQKDVLHNRPRSAGQRLMEDAENGDAVAQFNLGKCYAIGEGVEQDMSKAVMWIRKAAEQGFVDAQGALGGFYAVGRGVEKDSEEAVKWFHRAAEQGDDKAQCALGSCYVFGEGVEKNIDEATRWLRKAAEQGDATAQEALQKLKNMKTPVSSSVSGNPLRRFRFGESGTCMHNSMRLSGFYGFEKISLGYTSRKRLFSICLTACESSDSMVRALMEECDIFYSGIRWKEDRNYKGELFAVGRRRDSQGRVELLVSIIPQPSNDEERIQANIINYDVKRIDDGDE